MTDHLDMSRHTERQAYTDADHLSAIAHALIAIAERMGEPRPGVLLTTETEPDPVADALDEMAARQAEVEPVCPRQDCAATGMHWHDWTDTTRCYRPRRQEGER